MSKNMLRAPLVKSAVLLGILSLLVYVTVTSPGGSVLHAAWVILLALFRAVQFGVGLVLAVALCLVLLAAIFLGSVALVSRENAAGMYERLRRDAGSVLARFAETLRSAYPGKSGILRHAGAEPDNTMAQALRSELSSLQNRLQELQLRITEQEAGIATLDAQVRQQGEEGQSNALDMAALQETLDLLQSQVKDIADRTEKMSERLENIEQREQEEKGLFEEMRGQLDGLEGQVKRLGEKSPAQAGEPRDSSDRQEELPRLFSYLEDAADQERLERLMDDIADRDMTQAQVIEYLTEQGGGRIAEIIEAHPSLTRDYIRDRRSG